MGNQTGTLPECNKVCDGMLMVSQRQQYKATLLAYNSTQQQQNHSKSQSYQNYQSHQRIKQSKAVAVQKQGLSLSDTNMQNTYAERYSYLLDSNRKPSPLFQLIEKHVHEDYVQLRPQVLFPGKAKYVGQWSHQKFHGNGKLTLEDGTVYQGQFQHGKASGKGRISFHDKDVYEGQWLNNMANGFGVYQHRSGAVYEGYWLCNLQHGVGVEVWNDKSRYEGSYKAGKKHGQGKYSWSDGSYYIGSWVNNVIEGYGEYYWVNGRSYKGNWINNQMHGKGVHEWEDGRRYEGDYVGDRKEGSGKYYWPDGKCFDGKWVNGKRQGLGKMIWNKATEQGEKKYKIGLWQNDVKIRWLDSEEAQNLMDSVKEKRSMSRTNSRNQKVSRHPRNSKDSNKNKSFNRSLSKPIQVNTLQINRQDEPFKKTLTGTVGGSTKNYQVNVSKTFVEGQKYPQKVKKPRKIFRD